MKDFKQNLTYSEQERLVYIQGDKGNSNLLSVLSVLDDYNQEGFDLDETLDELGLYGERGELLYDKVIEFKKELAVYKEFFEAVKSQKILPSKIRELVKEVKDELDL